MLEGTRNGTLASHLEHIERFSERSTPLDINAAVPSVQRVCRLDSGSPHGTVCYEQHVVPNTSLPILVSPHGASAYQRQHALRPL